MKCSRSANRLLFQLILLLGAAGASLPAQVSTATLTGIVHDPSAAPVPGALVKATHEETGVGVSAATTSLGEYTLPLLPPGRYELVVEAQGFQRHSHTGITLEIGRVFRLDFTLELGQITQTVTVSGAAPLLESEGATVGQLIENKTIVDMPLNGRRIGDLMALMGSSVFISGDIQRPRVSIAGGRGDQQMWLMDGVNAENQLLDIPQTNFNPPVEAMQEFRVLQNNYSAEFGNTSGGVVILSTKSGTNQFHGSAYEFFRNDALDARNFFAARKAPLRWNIFGFAAGGPVVRNRTFFFVSNEWQKQRIGVTRLFTVPTPQQRAGDFSQTLANNGALLRIYDPNTSRPDPANASRTIRDPFPNNRIPENRLDPVGQKVAALFPLPNRAPSNAAGANNFGRNGVNGLDLTSLTIKMDHQLSANDRLSGRFVRYVAPVNNSAVFDEPGADPFAFRSFPRTFGLMLNEIHHFSPTLFSDFRFNWAPRTFHLVSPGLGQSWPSRLGLKGVADRAFPFITFNGLTNMSRNNHENIQNPIHDTHIVENLSWYRRSHALRFGGEIRLIRFVNDWDRLISGRLDFGPQPSGLPGTNNTGHTAASLLLGFPNAGEIHDQEVIDRRMKYFALFVQDDWKASPHLTVNLGVRWETHTPRFDAADRQSGFDPFAINPVSNTPGVVTFAGRDGIGRNVWNGDYNNVAPRIGLAWKPFGNGRTVVRSGYGLFYGPPLPGCCNTSAGFETSGSFSTPDNGITPPFLLRDGFPAVGRPELGPGFGAVAAGRPVRFGPEFIEKNRRIGYSQQFNFGIQREIGWAALLEVSYLGNLGHKVPGQSININQVPEDRMGPGNAQIRRPYPQFSNVTSITPMWGNSSYHGLNIKVEKRFSHGLNFLANYSFSKFIDDVPTQFEEGAVGGGPQNLYHRAAEKALSGNDVRNRFVFSSVYELPAGKGRRWLSQGALATVLGGWNTGLSLLLQDGSPMGLVTQVNTTNAFTSGAQRVNLLRNPELPASERRVERWFDTNAAVAPPAFTFGSASRAVLTGPGRANVDLSLLKNHRWSESYNFQVRFEAFNLFNRANFQEPGRALGSPGFGVISAARDARILQLGLKFEF